MQNNIISNVSNNKTWQLFDYIIGDRMPFFLMAGPCVIESEQMAMDTAGFLKEITSELGLNFIYKSSYDKANRTSKNGFRGLGIDSGLSILEKIKKTFKLKIVTDVHNMEDIEDVAQVVDIIQTPAFLCRQTDFILKVASTGCVVNIKKGQFLSPYEMQSVTEKALSVQNHNLIMACERGFSFGYNNLVSDMRSLVIMRNTNCPIVFDATHSVQSPGALGGATGGNREFIPYLAQAAIATGIHGLFMETHPDPDTAKSDGPNSWPMYKMRDLLIRLIELDKIVKQAGIASFDQ